MAAGWLTHLAGDRVEVRSAGSAPADQVNPAAVEAMAEVGIDIADQSRRSSPPTPSQASDVVITMGCGDACPVFPGKRYEDWDLDDPAGQGVEAVRPIRDEIRRRVEELIAELLPPETRSQGVTTEVRDVVTHRLGPGRATPPRCVHRPSRPAPARVRWHPGRRRPHCDYSGFLKARRNPSSRSIVFSTPS